MKQILALTLVIFLAGCAGLQNSIDLAQEAFTPRPNPITHEQLYEVENGMVIAVTGLNVYKKLCIRKVIDRSCRDTVAHLQTYTRKAKPILVNLRKFVKENDQVNAPIAYATIKQTLADLKRETPVIGAP